MKRPAFQFYPSDWRNNSNLRRCSWAARGAWLEVMCLMHDADEYGTLCWTLKEIAQALGCPMALLKELVDKGVIKGGDKALSEAFIYTPRSGRKEGQPVTLVGTQPGPLWYSSRMVRDEYVRTTRGNDTRFGERSGEAPTHQPNPPNRSPMPSPKGGFGEGSGEAPKPPPNPAPSHRQGDGSTSSSSSSIREEDKKGELRVVGVEEREGVGGKTTAPPDPRAVAAAGAATCPANAPVGLPDAPALARKRGAGRAADLPIPGVDARLQADWLAVRRARRAGPVTQTVIDSLEREAAKAEMSLADAVRMAAEAGWQGFRADWAANRSRAAATPLRPAAYPRFGDPGYEEAAAEKDRQVRQLLGFASAAPSGDVIDVTPQPSQPLPLEAKP